MLKGEVFALTKKAKDFEESIGQQGQYSQRTSLLIHGVKVNSNEHTNKLVLNVINNDLKINMT